MLDLLEIFVKRQPGSPFLFDAVMPLMEVPPPFPTLPNALTRPGLARQAILTAQASGPEKKSLAERMQGIWNKVCKVQGFARAPEVIPHTRIAWSVPQGS